MVNFDGQITTEYLKRTTLLVQKVKDRSYELMHLKHGQLILDLGCGPGIDTVAMAKLVGAKGKVFGIDIDQQMILEADRAAAEQGVAKITHHLKASCEKLPFEDNYFHSVRAERLLQVIPRTIPLILVLKEIIRVTRIGGIIALADTDWATASVDFPDTELEARLLYFFREKIRPNGYAGRQFFSAMQDLGLHISSLESMPILMFNFEETPFASWLTREALSAKIATEKELAHWNNILLKKSEQGRFFASANMILCTGTKDGG
jgi:ubiquinone/menaquinone biosynthesis C-methylase UbiE